MLDGDVQARWRPLSPGVILQARVVVLPKFPVGSPNFSCAIVLVWKNLAYLRKHFSKDRRLSFDTEGSWPFRTNIITSEQRFLALELARHQHRSLDLLRDIKGLKDRGYSDAEIARKTNLSRTYVRGVLRLLESGEHRLLRAVESGKTPVSVAVDIADAGETETQDILRRAYESEPPPLKWSAPIVRKAEDQVWPLRDPSRKRLS